MVLSKEEKKALREAKKLEKLKAGEEARKKIRIQQLQREMAVQAKNKALLDHRWRDMVLQIKLPGFREDVEVMWHVFDRTLDKKDHIIQYTLKLLNTANDQFLRTISSFCETFDAMINKFLKELEEMYKNNQQRTKAMLKRGEDDAKKIMSDHDVAETHLQLLIYHGHTTADNNAWSRRGEYLVKQDEEVGKYTNIRENLQSLLEYTYNNMWHEYKNILRSYVVGTVDTQKKVRILRAKENLMAEIIDAQAKQIANSDNVLKYLRHELQQYESGTKQLLFRDRRNRHRNACKKLKTELLKGCTKDTHQLAFLVKQTDEAMTWLNNLRKKADKILRLARLCRRLETQKEKVLPFGSALPHPPTTIDIPANKLKNEDSLVINAISSTSGLNRLWQRIAKAELSRKALFREKEFLEEQNRVIILLQKEGNVEKKVSITNCVCTTSLENGVKTKTETVDDKPPIK